MKTIILLVLMMGVLSAEEEKPKSNYGIAKTITKDHSLDEVLKLMGKPFLKKPGNFKGKPTTSYVWMWKAPNGHTANLSIEEADGKILHKHLSPVGDDSQIITSLARIAESGKCLADFGKAINKHKDYEFITAGIMYGFRFTGQDRLHIRFREQAQAHVVVKHKNTLYVVAFATLYRGWGQRNPSALSAEERTKLIRHINKVVKEGKPDKDKHYLTDDAWIQETKSDITFGSLKWIEAQGQKVPHTAKGSNE